MCLGIFLSVAAVLSFLLPLPAGGHVGSCCTSLVCLFSLSWNTCSFSAPGHAAGGPSGVPLLADSGWLLYSCGDGFAWGWGCLVTVVLFPHCFLFWACAASGLQVGFPCCLFLTLEWVYFWLRCLQSLWATKAVSAALRGSSSSSCVGWSISFF